MLWDPDILPVGLQVESDNPGLHGMLFQHDSSFCHSSFQIDLESLGSLVGGDALDCPEGRPAKCDLRCQSLGNRKPCDLQCRFAPYHDLMVRLIESRDASGAVALAE